MSCPAPTRTSTSCMEQSADLVSVVHRFSQFVNVKGHHRQLVASECPGDA